MSMEVIQVAQQLNETTQRLSKSTKEVFKLARKRAQTEQKYRKELMKEIVKLREQDYPATLISDVARGRVADLKLERDLAKEMHRSAMQSISALEVEVQSWQSILRNLDEM